MQGAFKRSSYQRLWTNAQHISETWKQKTNANGRVSLFLLFIGPSKFYNHFVYIFVECINVVNLHHKVITNISLLCECLNMYQLSPIKRYIAHSLMKA